ncbi:MAG: hypothetical protein JOZ96_05265 [Acidobacteria bacterium]|nr:hypothetical protein [Acidobacteriota bacterium]
MRLRKLLSLTVLTAALLFTLLTGSPTKARDCPYDMCASLYNSCEASCNGNKGCIKTCKYDYNECLCSNCGYTCPEIP